MNRLTVLVVCLLASFSAAAQRSSDVEAAFTRYAAATKTYDTAAMTALMHPDALRRFRTTIDAALAGPKRDQAKKELLPLFAVTTVAAFSALSDAEAYRVMNETVAKGSPELINMMSKSTYDLVGSFIKDGVAYVTYNLKMTVEGVPFTNQVTQTLKMHNGKWLLMLPATADATIAGIEARFK